MARPRKPTALHLINGTIEHNRKRFADRANEPHDDRVLGPPPKKMGRGERAAWLEIEQLAPWLTYPDRIAVEVAACLLAQFRQSGVNFISPAKLARLETMLGRLGLTPSDRSKVSAPGRKPGNAFTQFGKRTGDTA